MKLKKTENNNESFLHKYNIVFYTCTITDCIPNLLFNQNI